MESVTCVEDPKDVPSSEFLKKSSIIFARHVVNSVALHTLTERPATYAFSSARLLLDSWKLYAVLLQHISTMNYTRLNLLIKTAPASTISMAIFQQQMPVFEPLSKQHTLYHCWYCRGSSPVCRNSMKKCSISISFHVHSRLDNMQFDRTYNLQGPTLLMHRAVMRSPFETESGSFLFCDRKLGCNCIWKNSGREMCLAQTPTNASFEIVRWSYQSCRQENQGK